ncbi:unnamed protein product [Discosporangium mesarthrocarpum]
MKTATTSVGLLALASQACAFHIATPIPGLAKMRAGRHVGLAMSAIDDIATAEGVSIDTSGPLKKITLSSGDAEADLYTLGACVTSYKVGGHDNLFVRPDAKLDGSKPISGGLPFCFPQFGPGEIQQHGFARNLEWDVVSVTGGATPAVTMSLVNNEETMAMWPHPFEMTYAVTLLNGKLSTDLTVKNTGDSPFNFQAALHSYFSCSDINKVTVKSPAFDGASFLNKMLDPPAMTTQEGSEITISQEMDSVYMGVSGEIAVDDAGNNRRLAVSNTEGWKDTVVWNPYGNAAMGADNFLCVESAIVQGAPELGPGDSWAGKMELIPGSI